MMCYTFGKERRHMASEARDLLELIEARKKLHPPFWALSLM